jgi:hypothetical protein
MTDIVERLRVGIHISVDENMLRNEAADEIERLQTERDLLQINIVLLEATGADASDEIDRLRRALRALADIDGSPANVANAEVLASRVRNCARAALGEANSISDNPPPCPNPEQACRQYQAMPGIWVCSNFGCARMPKQLKEQTRE